MSNNNSLYLHCRCTQNNNTAKLLSWLRLGVYVYDMHEYYYVWWGGGGVGGGGGGGWRVGGGWVGALPLFTSESGRSKI